MRQPWLNPYAAKQLLKPLRRHKFMVLLTFQLLFIFIYPLVEGGIAEWLTHVASTFVFFGAVACCPLSPRWALINRGLAGAAALIYSIDYLIYFTPLDLPIQTPFQWVYNTFFVGTFLYFTGTLGFHMLTDKEPRIDTLAGTAAVFLMIGLTWTFFYLTLDTLQDHAFNIATAGLEINYIHWLYYSISVLVSSGYNGISPASSYAQCLALLESIVGALYIAIITARIVGVPFHRLNEDDTRPFFRP